MKKEKRKAPIIDQEQAKQELEKGYSKAETVLGNKDKMNSIMNKTESKLKRLSKFKEIVLHVPVFIQLVKCFIKKEYTKVPLKSIIAIVSAIVYVLNPFDLIPDVLPVIGVVDDASVVGFCFSLVELDITEFLSWRDKLPKPGDVVQG